MSELRNPDSGPALAVVVPATDSPSTLARCLAALRAGERVPDELVVVREPRGHGPAAARNDGAARCRAEVLVFVDADVEVHADALSRLVSALAADPGLDAVFGAYDDSPESPGAVSVFRNLLHHHVHADAAGLAETFWAGLGAVRREAFEAVGGFDGRRFAHPSVEDIDLGYRLGAAGRRIELEPTIRGRHLKRWTLGEMLRTDVMRRGAPWVELQLRQGRPSGSLNMAPRHRLSALASALGAGAACRGRWRLAALALSGVAALNADFYRLLARRGGPGLVAAGIPLHVLHHLAAVASVPVGMLAHARRRP